MAVHRIDFEDRYTVYPKKMRDEEKTLATFKLNKKDWLDFQKLATAKGTNATQVLKNFISACLDGRIDFESIQPVEQPTFDLDERIDERLSPLLQEFERIKSAMDALEMKLQSVGQEEEAPPCPKCGSSDTIKKGKSEPNAKGETGKLIKCKSCGKLSTIR